jgi:hypothetical protein
MWSGFRNNTSKMTKVHISKVVEMDNIRANLPESGDANQLQTDLHPQGKPRAPRSRLPCYGRHCVRSPKICQTSRSATHTGEAGLGGLAAGCIQSLDLPCRF